MMEAANDNPPTGRSCTKCGEWKLFAEFNKRTTGKYGVNNECRECQKLSNRKTYEKYGSASRLVANRAWRAANPERKRANDAAWRAKNPEKISASQRKHYANNPDAWRRRKDSIAAWRKNNPEKVDAIQRRSEAKRSSRPDVRIHSSVSRAIRASFPLGDKAGRKNFDLLGYSKLALMSHLEANFLPGMSWENYGLHGWHIDHIVPKSTFVFQTTDDPGFRAAWALSNLQPMWATDNRKKHTKMPWRADNDNDNYGGDRDAA